MASFIEMVADIQNVKYPKIIEIFKEITKEDFNGDGDIGLQSIRDNISALQKSIEALEKNIPTTEQIRFMVLEALGENNDTGTKDYFVGIEVKDRRFSKEGYSAVYDPVQTPSDDGTYAVKATLTYYDKDNDMTYTKTFTFEETVDTEVSVGWIINGYKDLTGRTPKSDGTIASDAEAAANPSLIDKTGFDFWHARAQTLNNENSLRAEMENAAKEFYFKNISVTNRNFTPPNSRYAVSYNPSAPKPATSSVQNYTVTATVTYTV